ncbi:MAG: hypothetical protein KDC05_02095 [Bacteroidales bacterium]|nr:hypothetical protein [Bacteroidales bacterium]
MNSNLFTLKSIHKPNKWFILLVTLVFTTGLSYSQVAINNDNSSPNASAMLDVKATGLGLLAPRMTFANRPASPATGLIIYQTNNDPGYYYFDGSDWQKVGRATDQHWALNGTDIYNTNTGHVAVGTNDPNGHGISSENYTYGKSAVRGSDQSGTLLFAEGHLGLLNYTGNPLALPIDVPNIGVFGYKPNSGFEGAAIYGYSVDTDANNYAGIFATQGVSTNTNYGIYIDADSATTNYAGYFKGRVHVEANNNSTDNAGDYSQDVVVSEVTHNISSDTRAFYGKSTPVDGYGYGVYGEGGYRGVYGYGNGGAYTGTVVGVYGYAYGTDGTRVGLYGYAGGGTTNWAAYMLGSAYVSSDLRIGTTTAAVGYALSVNGKIACEEVLVQDNGSWPDYVFDPSYDLMSLEELEQHITEKNHLPGIPPATEVEETGFSISDMQKRVLEKVEELTLYTIEQGKMIKQLQSEVEVLKAENASLRK